jgi:hypothetical protein
MHRIFKILAFIFGILAVLATSSALVFEFVIVQPTLVKAGVLLASAAPSEKNLPSPVERILKIDSSKHLKFRVAREMLASQPSQFESMGTLRRQLTEFSLGLLLGIHLTNQELSTLFISQVHMGPGVRGFNQAATQYLGTNLQLVTLEQAARLVAISHAPSLYLQSTNRLEQSTAYLLSRVQP